MSARHSASAPPPAPLPIEACLEELRQACRPGSTVLLQAPPGAGKTTRVPQALLAGLDAGRRIVMLQPRRLAAIAAAERLASLLGESPGGQVGYRVRMARRVSASTRIEVQTIGLFLRQLQEDPALGSVDLVIFDEFHERQAEADLALALLRQARQLLRPDLALLLMSATLDLAPLARRLDGAAVITSAGRSFPVAVAHQPPRPDEPLPRQLQRALESHWLDRRGLHETVLVFLPGLREIQACQRALAACPWADALELTPLHGQLPLAQQSLAIAPARSAEGKVVLASSIAESSLTIQGVTLVVDAGLARLSRFDPRSGMDGLVTVPASKASAEQRRGRAGRLAPGRCLRLWSEADQQRRPDFDSPAILEADPLPLALQLAAWGSPGGEDLDWLEPPPAAALAEASQLLLQLGALSQDGRITPHGRAMASLGLHPRLSHLLLGAERQGQLTLGCALAVLLSERDPLERRLVGCDLLPRLDALRRGQGEARQLQRLQRQLESQVRAHGGSAAPPGPGQAAPEAASPAPRTPGPRPGHHRQGGAAGEKPRAAATAASAARPTPDAADAPADPQQVAQLLALAYPERVALSRGQGDGRFLMRGGRGAWLPAEDPLAHAPALAIAAVDGQGPQARVLLAASLPLEQLRQLAASEGEEQRQACWDPQDGRVRCERRLRLGALVLERRPWSDPDPEAVRAALLTGLRQLGLEALPWTPRSRELRHRLALAAEHLGPPWPDRRPETLQADPLAWLGPQLDGLRSRQDLQSLDLEEALWGDLPWSQRRELERLLPECLRVPSGRLVPIRYGEGQPVLAVKLQEMFGCRDTPSVLDGRLRLSLELLSPAGRPAALTQDLASFWSAGYPAVRRELRGRYPRHPWPEDPLQAPATALTKAAQARRAAGSP
ncbi:MAG: ATP-dependent helicase C-terminal domain-containing protein [Synechococcaceae cyanobacterium]|nr:ATP-dependent helicase C-terminal domain-containing protein [Synechococcaceae cyanobacterium]